MVIFLLRKGNAVWNLVDKLGYTAGDLAYSINDEITYEVLLEEGVRVEMLKAAMAGLFNAESDDEEDEDEEVEMDGGEQEKTKKSTAGDNATFLASKLVFTKDSNGQEVCLDSEGNGVMMGWEKDIMRETARRCCEERFGKAGEREKIPLKEREEMNVVNVGFGLGIVRCFDFSFSSTLPRLTPLTSPDRHLLPILLPHLPPHHRTPPRRPRARPLAGMVLQARRNLLRRDLVLLPLLTGRLPLNPLHTFRRSLLRHLLGALRGSPPLFRRAP